MKKQLFFLFFLVVSSLSFAQSSLDSLRFVLPVGHGGGFSRVEDFVFNSDKSNLVTVGTDKKMIIWDTKSEKELITCEGHTDRIGTVDYSFDDSKIATGSWDKTIKIWDAKNGSLLHTLEGHQETVDKVFFSKKNSEIVFSISNGRGNHEIFVWDLKTGKRTYEFTGDIAILDKNEEVIFVGNSRENIISSYSIQTGKKINDYSGLTSSIYCLDLNSDNTRLLAAGGDGVPIVWDVMSSRQLLRLQGHKTRIFHAGFSPNDKYIYTSDEDELYKLWSSETGDLLYEDKVLSIGNSALFSSNSKYFAYFGSNCVNILEMKNFSKVIEIPVSGYYGSKMVNSLSSQNFAYSNDNSIDLYEYATGKRLKSISTGGKSIFVNLNSKLSISKESESNLENYVAGSKSYEFSDGYYFIFKICEPHLINFINDTLIQISKNGKTGVILKEKKLLEVNLPEMSPSNNFRLEITNSDFNRQLFQNFQLSDQFAFLEYNDSIYIFNRKTKQLIKELSGHNLSLSNNVNVIGFTSNETNNWEQNSNVIYKIDSEDTLFFNKTNEWTSKIVFSPNNDYFLTLSASGAWDYHSIIYKISDKTIIDTISPETNNAVFTVNNLVLHECPEFHENRNNLMTFIEDFKNHSVLDTMKGENPQLDSQKKYYSTILNDTIHIYKENNFSYIKALAGHKDRISTILFNSANNKIVSSGWDNQIIVWDFEKGMEIYTYIILENNNWLIKLPNSPYYMCSKDASKMLHYVTPSLKVIGFEQLDPVYNRPDIVLDSIGKYFGGADQELVANYRQSWEKRIDRLGLDKEKLGKGEIAVPNAEIVDAVNIAYENKAGKLNIKVSANDPKYLLRRFNVFVNEVPLYGSAGISIAHLKKQVWDTTVNVPLSVGENKIQVSVMNELGLENFKYPTYVNYTPTKEIVAKTHYIGIGVNAFQDSIHNLKYCVKDVTDLAKSFGGANTEVKLFTDQQVTKENILALKEYLNKTNVNDKVIISCSSHGLLDDSLNFYLAMHDVDFKNPKLRGLKYEELESLLDGIPARQKLLLLDACNSGENDKTEILKKELATNQNKMDTKTIEGAKGYIKVVQEENKSNFKKMNELFVNVRNNTGSVIISAAGGQESALEAISVDGETIKNGAFTYSILECLKQNEGKELKVNTLKQYAEKRVEEITYGKQKPTSRQETMEVDWGVR
jgi:WD40 repeat protein